jgi:hypothetical protein
MEEGMAGTPLATPGSLIHQKLKATQRAAFNLPESITSL